MPWRRILVPEEHGVWSLWAEPAVLGLALAPSGAGALSWWGAALAVALAARTALMLRPGARPVHPARIGIVETLLGVAWVVALAATLPDTMAGGPA